MTRKKAKASVPDIDLCDYARKYAREQKIYGKTDTKFVSADIIRGLKNIKSTYVKIGEYVNTDTRIPQEFEWLLDNFYLAEREGRQAALSLKKAGLVSGVKDRKNLSAVFDLAFKLVRLNDNTVTPSGVEEFLEGAQLERALSEKELSIFIPMLKASLVRVIEEECLRLEAVLAGLLSKDEKNPFAAERAVMAARESGLAATREQNALAGKAHAEHIEISRNLGNAFTSIRTLGSADLTEVLERVSAVERTLKEDPAGIYTHMDDKTRAYYRRQISRLAKLNGITEHEAAKRVVALSLQAEGKGRHVGYYILERPFGERRKNPAGGLYILVIVLATIFITLFAGFLTGDILASLLILFPLSEIVKNAADFIVIRTIRPRYVPRMEIEDGIPEEYRTLCVISALLTSADKGSEYASLLEEYRTANRDAGPNIMFGILADLPDAPEKNMPDDDKIIENTRAAVRKLNEKHGGGYYLFARERVFNDRDKVYMGWERKRGALTELVRLLKNARGGVRILEGERSGIDGVRLLITLDGDTRLNAGSARELAGAMIHPINRPEIDRKRGVVTGGYGLLQPRISADLEAANRSYFSRIFAGQGGIDPYGSLSSDVYHDLFDEASFTGKGIIDVDAFFTCLEGRFPENRVLSHDLLEGGFLRAGLIGDVELTDSYPFKVNSYFERMHRWIRGDWQASYWLSGKIKNAAGETAKNPLSGMTKWKILDNMRRSLVPVFMTAAILTAMFTGIGGLAAVAAVAVLCAVSNLLLTGAELAFRGGVGLKERYHSTIIAGFWGAVLQTAVQLLFLPYQAFICLSAIFKALYRMFISKKRLLSWMTAEDADSMKISTIPQYYGKMAVSVVIGVCAVVFSGNTGINIAGICWILAPAAAGYMSAIRKEKKTLNEKDADFLKREASLIWRYFEDFLTKEDNFLPPDNWQEQPAAGIAHRTSPTNIGLALLCAVSALDLKLTDSGHALFMLENILKTVSKLPKWNGHLYNWYDTQTLRPLHPRCISTVDSGNLAGCLIALREALREIGGEQAEKLAKISESLERDIKFEPLYDKKRRLFYIGFDLEADRPTEGYYDLLASEARQTSYIAVARGEVPRRHWARLGRTLVNDDRYNGMASWTGTMFEYLMPNLLMPCYRNSLIYESAKFCVYEHKKRAARRKTPWGISESAFYSFDAALNYQYKAHGVQRLGLKRGLNRELVISPYSSFLALPVEPFQAVSNLRRLQKLKAEGKYGFFEALDYTQSRVTGSESFELVRCFMVHHLGMSMLAVNNALNDEIMQRRFMRDTDMKSFAELMQEKVPVGVVAMNTMQREIPEKPKRITSEGWRQEASDYDVFTPRCVLLSNGSYTLFLTDTGLSMSTCSGVSMTRFERRQHGGATGMQFFVKNGDAVMSLLPAPLFDGDVKYSSVFDGNSAKIISEGYGMRGSVESSVPENENCELREINIRNLKNDAAELELLCYFEPVLAPESEYNSHMSFSKLSLETDISENAVRIKRRARGSQREKFMVFACDNDGVKFDTSREKALGRTRADAPQNALSVMPGETRGAVLDPCVLARVKITVPCGGNAAVRFALGTADKGTDAYDAASRVLKIPKNKPSGRLSGNMRILGLTAGEVNRAFSMLGDLMFITKNRRFAGEYIEKNTDGQRGLWQFGISGDFPILAVSVKNEADREKTALIIKQHRFLSMNGARIDLALTVTDGGDYRRPVKSMIMDTLRSIDCENQLGLRGGVHIVDARHEGSDEERMIFAMSALLIIPGKSGSASGYPSEKQSLYKPLPPPVKKTGEEPGAVLFEYLPDGSVQFDTTSRLPDSAWCHTLSNGGFGYTATDAGTGHMWYRNARENKINRWKNDPQTLLGSERLRIKTNGFEISAFSDNDGQVCRVRYGLGFARWEKEAGELFIRTTAYVHHKLPARVFIIELSGEKPREEDVEILYMSELLMGADERAKNYIVTKFDPDTAMLTAKNAYTRDFMPQEAALCASPGIERFTCDYASWIKGRLDKSAGAGLDPCMGISLKIVKSAEKPVAVIVFGRAANENAKKQILKLIEPGEAYKGLRETREYWHDITGRMTLKTPDEGLNRYLNGWALYQVQACRVMGRSSIYQCGGAYGFRDQLQDVGALAMSNPRAVTGQLMRAAAHQFEEGDVQHWWHPGSASGKSGDKGVRTRCSDDLLWLPYILCEYILKTGDMDILRPEIPYIKSPPLKEGEHERYETPEISDERENLYGHSVRAIEAVIERGAGGHGLILIGGGDWNDGFDKVGILQKGESVWMTWFFVLVLEKFRILCERLGEKERAARYENEAKKYTDAANGAWDGNWFLRGYFDDGSTLGSEADEECKIDSIAQSFSTLVSGADREKSAIAMKSVCDILFDRKEKLIKLYSPPFSRSPKDPGYIKGYLPGVRENGGQYTHAAIWSAMGCFRAGMTEDGYEILRAILPSNHEKEIYKVEPYVVAADVYSNPEHVGRGGWSWYTGAASWYYRVATEELLGIKMENGAIYLDPKLPKDWNGFEAKIKNPAGELFIKVKRAGKGKKTGMFFDGKPTKHAIGLNGLAGEHILEYFI